MIQIYLVHALWGGTCLYSVPCWGLICHNTLHPEISKITTPVEKAVRIDEYDNDFMCFMALKLPRYFDLLMTYSSSVYCTNRLPSRTRKHLFLYPKLTDQVWESQEGWLKIIQFLIVRTIRWVGDRYIKRVISYLYTCYSPEVTIH